MMHLHCIYVIHGLFYHSDHEDRLYCLPSSLIWEWPQGQNVGNVALPPTQQQFLARTEGK